MRGRMFIGVAMAMLACSASAADSFPAEKKTSSFNPPKKRGAGSSGKGKRPHPKGRRRR